MSKYIRISLLVTLQTTIGYKRIIRFPKLNSNRLRLEIEDAKASPTISTLEVYNQEQ